LQCASPQLTTLKTAILLVQRPPIGEYRHH